MWNKITFPSCVLSVPRVYKSWLCLLLNVLHRLVYNTWVLAHLYQVLLSFNPRWCENETASCSHLCNCLRKLCSLCWRDLVLNGTVTVALAPLLSLWNVNIITAQTVCLSTPQWGCWIHDKAFKVWDTWESLARLCFGIFVFFADYLKLCSELLMQHLI